MRNGVIGFTHFLGDIVAVTASKYLFSPTLGFEQFVCSKVTVIVTVKSH
jgi:hypothetical protein